MKIARDIIGYIGFLTANLTIIYVMHLGMGKFAIPAIMVVCAFFALVTLNFYLMLSTMIERMDYEEAFDSLLPDNAHDSKTEQDAIDQKYYEANIKCDVCQHEYTEVIADDFERVKCPNCKQMSRFEILSQ